MPLQGALTAPVAVSDLHLVDSSLLQVDCALSAVLRALGHYGMAASCDGRDFAHADGAIEAALGHLKRALEDALVLPGSCDLDTLADNRGPWSSAEINQGAVGARAFQISGLAERAEAKRSPPQGSP